LLLEPEAINELGWEGIWQTLNSSVVRAASESSLDIDDFRDVPATHHRGVDTQVVRGLENRCPCVDLGEPIGCSSQSTYLLLQHDGAPRQVVADQ